ncbi:hypothetical protein AMTRI_Chr13g91900 [Amborella trichopoda]
MFLSSAIGKNGKKSGVAFINRAGNNNGYGQNNDGYGGAMEDQVHDLPNMALFSSEKDLKPGNHFTFDFGTKDAQQPMPTFLPRRVADTLPFSSSKWPEILAHFSVWPSLVEAKAMKRTLTECEERPINGEVKHCTTSLESMIDFSTACLEKAVQIVATTTTTTTTKTKAANLRQPKKYAVGSAVHQVVAPKSVACHAQCYAYAVFYCHEFTTTRLYKVPLLSEDGSTKVEAVAVCHFDTSAWNPNHVASKCSRSSLGPSRCATSWPMITSSGSLSHETRSMHKTLPYHHCYTPPWSIGFEHLVADNDNLDIQGSSVFPKRLFLTLAVLCNKLSLVSCLNSQTNFLGCKFNLVSLIKM